jgi:hypothetical protein
LLTFYRAARWLAGWKPVRAGKMPALPNPHVTIGAHP